MKILGIDTSSKSASCAVVEDSKVLGEYYINSSFQHSKTLIPMIESLLSNLELNISDIDLIGVTVGPGSFTGVRIGVSAVKGLALEKNIPCVPISSLEAAAMNYCGFDGIICPVMDARCNQLYNALFKPNEGFIERLCDDRVLMIDELESEIKNINKRIVLLGDGTELVSKKISFDNFIVSSEDNRYPRAGNVAILAKNKYSLGEFVDTDSLEPLYLRLPQAVRNLNNK